MLPPGERRLSPWVARSGSQILSVSDAFVVAAHHSRVAVGLAATYDLPLSSTGGVALARVLVSPYRSSVAAWAV